MQVGLLMANGADEPVSIEHLRKTILDLAVCGKLGTGSSSDGDAAELLKKHQKSGLPPRQEPSTQVGRSFLELPDRWTWFRFGDLMEIKGGSQPPKAVFCAEPGPGLVRLFQIRDLGDRPVPTYVPADLVTKFCTSNDVLVGRYGASVGKVFRGRDGAYNVALVKVLFERSVLSTAFVFHLLQSRFFQTPLSSASRSAQAGFNKRDIYSIWLPLPPLIEQHRIVAKVDELMARIDELEEAQVRREQIRIQTRQSSLHALVENGEWDRVRDNWDSLFTTPESVDDLRKAILDLAVRGRLVEQREEEGTGVKLIVEARALLQNQSKRRVSKKLPPVETQEIPFLFPDSWCACRLGACVEIIRGITFPGSAKRSRPEPDLIPCLRTANVQNEITWDDLIWVSEGYVRNDDQFVQDGDIVMSMANSRKLVGKVAYCDRKDSGAAIGGFLSILRPATILPHFLLVVLRTTSARERLIGSATQTTNIANISVGRLRPLVIGVPPLEEQHRIVAKIDELMALCDELEARLRKVAEISEQLAESVVHHSAA